jgi:hypothetical protein
MEIVLLVLILAVTVWRAFSERKFQNATALATTLYLNVDSLEENPPGVPIRSAHLQKRLLSSLVIMPGMELAVPGEPMPLLVVRVLFDGTARGIHLKSKRVPAAQHDRAATAYLENGWQDGG